MAEADIFLKIEGTEGESHVVEYKGWIQVLSYSWGETNSGSMSYGGGGGVGKVQMQDFHFVQKMNKASQFLFLKCATGEHISSATLEARKAGGKQEVFLKVKFKDLLITSYQQGAAGGGDALPTEQISFNFAQVEQEYFSQDEKGLVKSSGNVGYNLKEAKKI
jgi:type VI secretion system secreted protein Hcp